MVSGIASVGGSLAGIVSGPSYRVFIHNYDWRTTLVIHACVLLQVGVIGATYRPLGDKKVPEELPLKEKAQSAEDGQETEARSQEKEPTPPLPARKQTFKLSKLVDLNLFRNRQFLLYMGALFGISYTVRAAYTLGPSRAVSQGMESFRAAVLPSMIAVSSLVSRVINSLVANIKCLPLVVHVSVLAVGCGVVTCLFCVTSSFEGSIVFCSLYGICLGRSIFPRAVVRMAAYIIRKTTGRSRKISNFSVSTCSKNRATYVQEIRGVKTEGKSQMQMLERLDAMNLFELGVYY